MAKPCPDPSMPACIVPAAGASSRMGAHKLLLPFRDAAGRRRTMVETSVGIALEAGCRVILVVGRDAEKVAEPFSGEPRVVIVHNPDWERGMVGSIQRGIEALGRCSGESSDAPSRENARSVRSVRSVREDGFFIHHADMPLVEPAVFGFLRAVAASRAAAGAPPVPLFAAFEGRAGHPVYIPSILVPGILGLDPAFRMKPFLDAAGGLSVETGCAGVLADIDTPGEYAVSGGGK